MASGRVRLVLRGAIATLLAIALLGWVSGRVAARDTFKLPLVCGQPYVGSTYGGHPLGAIDFNQSNNADNGDPVLASLPGTVTQVYAPNGQVRVNHGGGWSTVYAHMSNITVSVDDWIDRGDQIGKVSDVGDATSAHLHFQELLNGAEQYATFDGVTYAYNTSITSTNCPSYADIGTLYGSGGTSIMHGWTSNGSGLTGAATWWPSTTGYTLAQVGDRFVSGDFNADSKGDIATFYDYGSGSARIHVWLSNGTSLAYQGANGWWSTSGYTLAQVGGRFVSGDFNGDSKDDVATFYDYGGGAARIHVWLSTGSSFTYQGNSGWWSVTQGYSLAQVVDRITVGDFNRDGVDDIATMYDYGSSTARIHVWLSDYPASSTFTYTGPNGWWISGAGTYPVSAVGARFESGDFNADGDSDIAAMYDYGSNNARIHVWSSNGSSSFGSGPPSSWWISNPGTYSLSLVGARFLVADMDADGDDDAAAFYFASTQRIDIWRSTGGSLAYQSPAWWSSTGYDLSKVAGRFASGDVTGQ